MSIVDPFAALVESIRRCTEVRGDTDAIRIALIEECGGAMPRHMPDLIKHFDSEAAAWAAATRGAS